MGGTGAAELTTASYSYGASSHRLQSVSAATSRSLNYLASGQMSSDVSGGVTKTYSYDAEGRMIAAYEGGVLQAAYDYDAYGHQVSKTEGGASIHVLWGFECVGIIHQFVRPHLRERSAFMVHKGEKNHAEPLLTYI